MAEEKPFVSGWLIKDLDAAIKEVDNWPEGMRRAQKSEATEDQSVTSKQGSLVTGRSE